MSLSRALFAALTVLASCAAFEADYRFVDDAGVGDATAEAGGAGDAGGGSESSVDGGRDGGGEGGGSHVILFGGSGASGPLGDTWSYDGSHWTNLSIDGPPESWDAAMAALGNTLVFFGGYDGSTIFGDTWRFSGGAWNNLNLGGGPPDPRRGQCMASLGSAKVVMFGGLGGTGTAYAETWIFDGSSWTQGPAGPPARYGCAMAAFGKGVFMFGGQSSPTEGSELDDSWTFDGTTWTLQKAGPSARTYMSMAARAGTVVTYGGFTSGITPVDTWVFNGSWSNPNVTGPLGTVQGTNSGILAQMATFGSTVLLYGGGSDADMWSFDGLSWTDLGDNQAPGIRVQAAMATLP